jgi:retron-type reverse transcriptase
VLNTGIFPDKLKTAKVIPIFKKGDPTLFKNYRPISVLSTLSKVLEKIIFTQLSSYFNETKLFFDNQYGFTPKHCTEYAALELVDRIINHMDKNEVPINIFLDLSKAFDTIDHNILLHKLRFYGLDGSTLLLFEGYLSNRPQYVEIDEMQSETLPVLFTICINDFPQVSNIINFITYAYDTTLSSTLNQFEFCKACIKIAVPP